MKWICAAAACLVAGLSLIVSVGLSKGFSSLQLGWGKQEVLQPVNITVNEAFHSLDIEMSSSDVMLCLSPDGSCSVLAGESENVVTDVAVKNGVLTIRREYKKNNLWTTGDDSVTVFLPEEAYRSLRIETTSGNIDAMLDLRWEEAALSASSGDIRYRGSVEGPLTINTTSGEMLIKDTDCEMLSLQSTSGSITVNGLRCEQLQTVSTSGDQILFEVTGGSLKASATSGEFELRRVSLSGPAEISATSGDVELDRVDARSFRIETSSGEVTGSVLRPMRFVCKTSSGEIRVPEDDPAGGEFNVSTTSGDIRIEIA